MNGHDIADFIDLGAPFEQVIGLAIAANCPRRCVPDAVQALPEFYSHTEMVKLLESATKIVADRPDQQPRPYCDNCRPAPARRERRS